MFYGIDPLYWAMMLPVMVLSLFFSFLVKSAFKKYSKISNSGNITGKEMAEKLLRMNGINDVSVLKADGFLSDHYNPSQKVIKLSSQVYESSSVAAIGIAAHETGHAVQDAQSYTPLKLRNMMVPVASIGSNFSWVVIIAGMFLGAMGLVKIGIVLFSIVVAFQIITLPVEFNASSRAKRMMHEYALVSETDMKGVSKVLNAAAMTYVAAAASSIMTLLYFLIRSGILGGDD
jgi:Zn-dependent membrane protease YugP